MLLPQKVGYHEAVVAESVDGPCQVHDHGHFHDFEDVDLESEDGNDSPRMVDVEGFDRAGGDVQRQN